MINHFYAVWLIVSGALALILAGFIWRRRAAPGGLPLFALLLALTVWDWMYAGYWLTPDTEAKRFWLNLAYIGVVVSTPAFLIMALQFTARGGWLTRVTYVMLSIPALLTLAILWTDPFHHLFFGGIDFTDPANLLTGGAWFWFHVIYSHAISLTGFVVLGSEFARRRGLYRLQLGVLILGTLIPSLGNLATLFLPPVFPGLDLTPMLMLVSGIFYTYGLFGLRLMDLTHISRDALVESLNDGVLVVDLQNRVVDLNARAMELASPVESPIGKPVTEVFARWKEVMEKYDLPEARFQLQLPEPPYSHLDVSVLPFEDKNGRVMGRLITWRDISEEKKVEEALRIFRHALEQSPLSILITDENGYIEYVNRQFTNITGYSLADVMGKTPRILKSGETPDITYQRLWDTIKRGEVWEAEVLNRKKDGGSFWAHELIAPVLDGDGRAHRFISMQQDITERRRTDNELRLMNTRLQMQLMEIEHLHDQLREEAIRDSLTRLFNRRFMEETLDREISRTDREPSSISVVMMDVDLFKSINDTHGHQAGDTVLQTLGTLLLENTRISDIACRYGGDEMVVVMPGATLGQAAQRAEEWRAAFSMLEFSLGEARVKTTLSFGIASFPEHAGNPNQLLSTADRALYRAKIERNCVVLYDPDMRVNHTPGGEEDHAGG